MKEKNPFTEVPLTKDQTIAYKRICEELAEESKALFNRDRTKESVRFLPPRETKYRPKKGRQSKCLVTGKKIEIGTNVVAILTDKIIDTTYDKPFFTHIPLGFVCNKEHFYHLLSFGSLLSFRTRIISKKKVKESVPLQKQNECHCVQCGERVYRSDGIPLQTFAKTYRCKSCKEKGVRLNSERFCRSCAKPFHCTKPNEKSRRLCNQCQVK